MRSSFLACFAILTVAACGSNGDPAPADMAAGADLASAPDLAPGHCEPLPVSNLMSIWHPPIAAHQNKCTAQQISDGVDALLGGTYVSTWKPANADCAACLITEATDGTWGPLVHFTTPEIVDGNGEGCVALLTGDASATSCGAKGKAFRDCFTAACGPTCPITTNGDIADFNKCIIASAQDSCAAQANDYNTCAAAASAASSTVNSCFLIKQPDVKSWFVTLGTLFCGG